MNMSVTDFEQRRKEILQLIVEAYVESASPVGSELVSRKLRASLSPATIRNTMVELERAGLLEQPHTSAGRVPTDRGYRFYVDTVIGMPRLTPDELRAIEFRLQPAELDPEQLLQRASTLLAELTGQAAFAVSPTVKQSTVKQIEFVPLGAHRILCVLVANDEVVAAHAVVVQESMSRDEAAALGRFLNTELAGLSFVELVASLERRMLAQTDSFYHAVKRSLAILQDALSTEPNDRLFLQGASRVVSQPEFSRDPVKARDLLRGLDDEAMLLERLRQDISPDAIHVRIGHELQLPGLEECSYVAAACAIGGEVIGGLGVLGPRRMAYARMRALVEGVARSVTGLLTQGDAR
jgi:heat-inducible transcriptional repressor